MELSLLLARLFGFYFLIVGCFWILRRNYMPQVFHDYYKSPALVVVTGILSLLIGLLILLVHPVFEWNWRISITLIGILSTFVGLMRLFVRDFGKERAVNLLHAPAYHVLGVVMILIGLFLAYHGYQSFF